MSPGMRNRPPRSIVRALALARFPSATSLMRPLSIRTLAPSLNCSDTPSNSKAFVRSKACPWALTAGSGRTQCLVVVQRHVRAVEVHDLVHALHLAVAERPERHVMDHAAPAIDRDVVDEVVRGEPLTVIDAHHEGTTYVPRLELVA